jgi:ferric enterobactin transport system permease protein
MATGFEAGRAHRVWRSGRVSLILSPRAMLAGALLCLALIVLAWLSLVVGAIPVPSRDVLAALAGMPGDGSAGRIILDVRLPRVVTAVSVGAALGVSGAIFQSVSRNVLGSPDIMGFLTGAATGAIGWIVLFGISPFAIAAAAVAGGLLTAALVYLLALRNGALASHRLVLVGIGVGAVLGAVNGLLLAAGQLDNAVTANLWLAGSLAARTWGHALPVAIAVLLLTPLAALLARPLGLIEMGDDIARQLGIRVERCRLAAIGLAVVLAALATGAAGPIAFIALAAPRIARNLARTGDVPILLTALTGAVLLTAADGATRWLALEATLPIGRVTGLVGGLYLAWLVSRSRTL